MTPIITPNHHATGPNVASAGHPLATEAAVEIYKKGGNAIDAACAAAFVMHVVEPHQNGIAGEDPLLIYSICSIDKLVCQCHDLPPVLVPPGVWVFPLDRYYRALRA